MAEKRNRKTNEERIDIKELVEKLKDAAIENRKIVLPAVLVIAILITMGIGISANKKKQQLEEVQTNAALGQEKTADIEDELTVPDVGLEENAYPEINELIMKYYKALEETDTDALTEIVSPLTDSVLIRFTEWAKHTQACPAVNIYTKPGPREDSYIAYVVADIQIVGYEGTVPGLSSFFICKNDAGNYFINMEEEIDKEEADYIEALNFQDDVADLSNKVSAEFNQLMQSGSEAAQVFLKVEESITKGIQEALLAGQEAQQSEEAEASAEEATQEETPQETTMAKRAKAIDVVNMRSSDSEKADKLGKAQIGDEFDVLEERANGWTKLTDGTREFFMKSEYLEIVSEEPVETPQETETEGETQTEQRTETAGTSPGSDGYVTATTTVNVRKSASETAERLGTIYMGEKLELMMNQADGWSKVKYKGQTAYVKSEFLE